MSRITYTNKVENSGATADGRFSAANANEVKNSVNAAYNLLPIAIFLVQQTGTSAPTATVVINDSGKTFTAARSGAGEYSLTPNSGITGTVMVEVTSPTGTNESRIMAEYSTGLSRIQLKTYDLAANAFADGIMGDLYLKVYQFT